MNSNYKDLVKEEQIIKKIRNSYKIYVECDANDGDCIDTEFEVDDIFADELFFLVLCYLCTDKAFGYPNKNYDNVFGDYIGGYIGGYSEGDHFFEWMEDYCTEYGRTLLLFAGMCDCRCHSIVDLQITHYVQGNKYRVLLPSIDEIFDTEQEMVDYMNNLYDKQ